MVGGKVEIVGKLWCCYGLEPMVFLFALGMSGGDWNCKLGFVKFRTNSCNHGIGRHDIMYSIQSTSGARRLTTQNFHDRSLAER